MAPENRTAAAAAIAPRLVALGEYARAGTVMLYAALDDEVATAAAIAAAIAAGKRVALPRINVAARTMAAAAVDDHAHDLRPGAWGIPEPLDSPEVDPAEIERLRAKAQTPDGAVLHETSVYQTNGIRR